MASSGGDDVHAAPQNGVLQPAAADDEHAPVPVFMRGNGTTTTAASHRQRQRRWEELRQEREKVRTQAVRKAAAEETSSRSGRNSRRAMERARQEQERQRLLASSSSSSSAGTSSPPLLPQQPTAMDYTGGSDGAPSRPRVSLAPRSSAGSAPPLPPPPSSPPSSSFEDMSVDTWGVREVEAWLSSVDLGHLAPSFAAAEIDGVALCSLTDDDLKAELGLKLGPRKKVQAALAAGPLAWGDTGNAGGGGGGDSPNPGRSASMPAESTAEALRVKVISSASKSVLSLPLGVGYEALVGHINGSVDGQPVRIEYRDDEGDLLRVASQQSWRGCLHDFVASGESVLKLYVTESPGPMAALAPVPAAYATAAAAVTSTTGEGESPAPLTHEDDVAEFDTSEPMSLEHIALGSIIGEGAFGKVYLGQDRRTGRLLAVKQLRVAADEVEGGSEAVSNALAEAEAEIGILTTCVHRNIVRCLGSERTAGPAGPGPNAGGFFLHIFMEYVSGGSVASLIGKVGPLGEAVVRRYTRQLCEGLAALHGARVVHRDLKAANLLISGSGATLKISDFGTSRMLGSLTATGGGGQAGSFVGTPFWMSPEVVNASGHGTPADVWSLACTVVEMMTGEHPWRGMTPIQALFRIGKAQDTPDLPPGASPECAAFLTACFALSADDRPTAADLLGHAWLDV